MVVREVHFLHQLRVPELDWSGRKDAKAGNVDEEKCS